MGISLKTQKMLWGRAASRCAFPDCRTELVMDETETDDESLVGEACHIVARSSDGPRGQSIMTTPQRDKYKNLILLCNVHHKLIDDQPGEYNVETLHSLKRDHEEWVKSKLAIYDGAKQKDEELYAAYIDHLNASLDFENWKDWTSSIFSYGQPAMSKSKRSELETLRSWLLSRIWPRRHPNIESAFENIRRVLQDFLNTFDEYAIDHGKDHLITEKFYKNAPYELHDKRVRDYEEHCYLIEDLCAELTRAANLLLDRVREAILPSYRLHEGVLLIMVGPCEDLTWKVYRPEYEAKERVAIPYGGLRQFSSDQRFTRDVWFGDKP